MVIDAETSARRWRGQPLSGLRELLWSPRNDRLLALGRRRLTLYGAGGAKHASRALPSATRRARRLDAGWRARALVRRMPARRAARSSCSTPPTACGRGRCSRLGRFGAPAWSPSGHWLLLPWPDADQWLLLRPQGRGGSGGAARRTARATSRASSRPAPSAARFRVRCSGAVLRAGVSRR
jgi:hypothetical protein